MADGQEIFLLVQPSSVDQFRELHNGYYEHRTPSTKLIDTDSGEYVCLIQDSDLFRQTVPTPRAGDPVAPQFATAEEVRAEARGKSEDIFAHQELLKNIVERFESEIQMRWSRMTKAPRQKVLLEVWPGMSLQHNPDFHAARACTSRDGSFVYSQSDRDAYTYPQINIEDLSTPRIFLILLNSRARHEPWQFWRHDHGSTSLAFELGLLEEVHVNRHLMQLGNRQSPQTYGEIVEVTTVAELGEKMKDGALRSGAGLNVLHIQERLLQFLLECCYSILDEVDLGQLLTYPVLSTPELPNTSSTKIDSQTGVALEAPYLPPNGLDIAAMKALFNAQLAAAEDHIWALRQDPAYFLDTLKQAMNHRFEQVRDESGEEHHLLFLGRGHEIWGSVVSNIVASADWTLEVWSRLCSLVDEVETDYNQDEQEILNGGLPTVVKLQLCRLRDFLEHVMRGPIAQLRASFYASPTMRPFVERPKEEPPEALKTGIHDLSLKGGPATEAFRTAGAPELELLWLIDTLTNGTPKLGIYRNSDLLSLVCDELGRLVQNQGRAGNLISSHVARIISDIGVISEALRQIDQFIGRDIDMPTGLAANGNDQRVNACEVPWMSMLDIVLGDEPGELFRPFSPPTDRFYYPSERPRTKDNHEAMRAAESNLDAFWNQVDANINVDREWLMANPPECHEEGCDCSLGLGMKNLLAQRNVHRLGPWIEKTNQAMQRPRADEAAPDSLPELCQDLDGPKSTLPMSSQSRPHAGLSKPKPKPKARGTPKVLRKPNVPAIHPQLDDPPRIFAVDARALRVFKTIFFNPSASSKPGEVLWLDFVHALVSMGFGARKLWGSEWAFQPKSGRRIVFHEPHPSKKIPYWQCRDHGRRLNRRYGWTGEMFVMAEKKA